MAPFDRKSQDFSQLDWKLMRDGPVIGYQRLDALEEDVSWFESRGYRVLRFACRGWATEHDMHADLKHQLDFPDYYGYNLNALWACLAKLEFESTTGCVLVFERFDSLLANVSFSPGAAWRVLDIVARAARRALLFGNRLLAFVQSDLALPFEPLGGSSVHENPRERQEHFQRALEQRRQVDTAPE
jgi:hypothetical protein